MTFKSNFPKTLQYIHLLSDMGQPLLWVCPNPKPLIN